MEYRIERLNIANLMLNTNNPRFESVRSQKEAINIMFKYQQEKLFKLAEDIIQHGLNPSDLIIVNKVKGKNDIYLVLEGNRRVTALKILNEIDLIDDINGKLKKKFRELQENHIRTIPVTINCVIFEDEEDANRWIELKHTGENEGVGIVGWDYAAQLRYKAKIGGETKTALQVINYIKKSDAFSKEIKHKVDTIPITNLQRLIDDPDVRSKIGLTMENKIMKTQYPDDEISKGLSKIVLDLANGDITVKNIYYKADRIDYINSFIADEVPNKEKAQAEKNINDKYEENNIGIENDTGLDPKKTIQTDSRQRLPLKKDSSSRKFLIPNSSKINISNARINDIYLELKNLDIEGYRNSVSVLLRVFIELSADEFIDAIGLNNINIDSTLKNKINKIADYMKVNGYLNMQQLQPIKKMISSHNNLISINTMNGYVHNKEFHPSPIELKIIWNNIESFIKKIWMLIREENKTK